ncbi:MAG TPA: ATP-binding protein [Verrucomicrobiae bacterium]|nr:ATP-binding protein [Verrucomicrobiae bacterium]
MNLFGRDRELRTVREHLCAGRNLVVFGAEGVGKTALVTEASRSQPNVLYCADTATLKTACESLLAQLNLAVSKADNIVRKRTILKATAGTNRSFVFDHVGRVGPKLASLLDNIHESHPMIVVTRSLAWSDMGHLKMILWDFDKLELAPLAHDATLQVLRAQIKQLKLRVPAPERFETEVLRITGHNLHILRELCQQAKRGHYIFGRHVDTRLLNLDRRIKELDLP